MNIVAWNLQNLGDDVTAKPNNNSYGYCFTIHGSRLTYHPELKGSEHLEERWKLLYFKLYFYTPTNRKNIHGNILWWYYQAKPLDLISSIPTPFSYSQV
jgi:hypothetical protein